MTKRQRIVLEAQRELKRRGKPKLAKATQMLKKVKARGEDYESKRARIVQVLKKVGHSFLQASKVLDAAAVGKHVAGDDPKMLEDAFRGIGVATGIGEVASSDALQLAAAFHKHNVDKVLPKIKAKYKGAKLSGLGVRIVD
jgi:ElaB/YqjD/DUF883 family membrane-anchored ribosome-binding protein